MSDGRFAMNIGAAAVRGADQMPVANEPIITYANTIQPALNAIFGLGELLSSAAESIRSISFSEIFDYRVFAQMRGPF